MTHKEIADELRDALDPRRPPFIVEQLRALIAKLDPPRPEPGTVVEATHVKGGVMVGYAHTRGICENRNSLAFLPGEEDTTWKWEEISSYKELFPNILAPDEVAVKVPPVSEWPDWAYRVEAGCAYRSIGRVEAIGGRRVITREEAERMEEER